MGLLQSCLFSRNIHILFAALSSIYCRCRKYSFLNLTHVDPRQPQEALLPPCDLAYEAHGLCVADVDSVSHRLKIKTSTSTPAFDLCNIAKFILSYPISPQEAYAIFYFDLLLCVIELGDNHLSFFWNFLADWFHAINIRKFLVFLFTIQSKPCVSIHFTNPRKLTARFVPRRSLTWRMSP